MTDIEADIALVGDRVGSFRFSIAGERWEWSDEVARMHGYEPGSVAPTTELVLAHEHAGDKPAVTSRGRVRIVVVVGSCRFDEAGEVIGTAGF